MAPPCYRRRIDVVGTVYTQDISFLPFPQSSKTFAKVRGGLLYIGVGEVLVGERIDEDDYETPVRTRSYLACSESCAIGTFAVREVAVRSLEQEVPKSYIGYVKGWVEGVGRHGEVLGILCRLTISMHTK